MKILFVSSGNTPFSIVPFIKSQEESIARNGVDIHHFVVFDKGLKGYRKAISDLMDHLKENKYDLIHAHYSFCGWVARLASSNIPIIVSYMGSDVYGKVGKTGRLKLTSIFEVATSQLLQPFVDRIIVKSENLRKFILLKNKSVLIPNGVDFELNKPRDKSKIREELGITSDLKQVLFLGNPNDPRKNFKLLKQAAEKNASWAILNPYPVQPSMVPKYINAADVLILCSFKEGSPNVVKEAMAANCPVVGTDVGDVKEIISNTQGCYLSTFDAEDLKDKITKSLTHSGETTGREDIAHLEINLIARRIIDLYKEVLSDKTSVQ